MHSLKRNELRLHNGRIIVRRFLAGWLCRVLCAHNRRQGHAKLAAIVLEETGRRQVRLALRPRNIPTDLPRFALCGKIIGCGLETPQDAVGNCKGLSVWLMLLGTLMALVVLLFGQNAWIPMA
jgi:hypothetical protein